MASRIQLAPGLDLPLDIVTLRSLVLGVSGSGKSTFGRLLAEKIHAAHQRFCVIDLKNDWWGLKSTADGKSAAIPVVIIGGPRGDIPLEADAGAAVADIVAEEQHSFVIDLDDLSKGKQTRFLRDFFERLYDVNRDPLLLICDEADRYAPQKPMSTDVLATLGAADDIARRGRKRGIGTLWLSQRPAVVNKNITSQCELVVTFRTSSSLDLKELKEHIGRVASAEQVAETMKRVGGLANGEAIFMSQAPETRMFVTAQLPMPRTFDSSATPKVGQRRIEPEKLAAPDLESMGERILAAREKAKAEDPKELHRRIRELETEVQGLQLQGSTAEPLVITETVEVPVLAESQVSVLTTVADEASAAMNALTAVLGEVKVAILSAEHKEAKRPAPAPRMVTSERAVYPGTGAAKVKDTVPAPARDASAMTPAKQSILDALAWLRTAVDEAHRNQVAFAASTTPTSSYYVRNVGELRNEGYLDYPRPGVIALTAKGVAAAVRSKSRATTAELHRRMFKTITEPAKQRVVEALIDAYPKHLTRPALAAAAETTDSSSYFVRNVGELKSVGVLDYPAKGTVKAEPMLFIEGEGS